MPRPSPRAQALDKPRCGAKKRAGGTCRQFAGERTAHPGEGKCWRHGGVQAHGDARVTTGLHSPYLRTSNARIRALIEEQERNPDPLNLLPEVAALRALFLDFINRWEEITEALLAWHASWQLTRRPLPEDKLLAFEAVIAEWEIALAEQGENATDKQKGDIASARAFVNVLRGADDALKPRKMLDVTAAHQILGQVGTMVERIEKIRLARKIEVVSDEVRLRLRRQIALINEQETWTARELLDRLGAEVWL